MFKNWLFVLSIYFFLPNVVLAQTSHQVIYLKNGSIIHGTILEMIPGNSLKIQTVDKNIFVFKMEEVDKVLTEKNPLEEPKVDKAKREIAVNDADLNEDTHFTTWQGYTNITKLGPMGFSAINLTEINGYSFNSHLFLGLGVSLDYYRGNDFEFGSFGLFSSYNSNKSVNYFLPIFFDFRYHVNKKNVSFLTYFDLGYSPFLGANNSVAEPNQSYNYDYRKVVSGGIYFSPGIGMRVLLTKHVGLVLDFGLKFQNFNTRSYNYSYNGSQSVGIYTEYTAPRLAVMPVINIGMTFR